MTDRQTDRSACWIATVFNEEIHLIEDASKFPAIVKEVHGGREMCPTSGKLHFQGAIFLHNQQRLSALKKWLPTAHWEIAKSRDAVKRYCMKQETAVGDKTVRVNKTIYLRMDEWLTLLGNEIRDLKLRDIQMYIDIITDDPDRAKEYWWAVNRVLPRFPHSIATYSNSQTKTAFRYTAQFWEQQPTLSITESADKKEIADVGELISPAEIYNADETQVHEA